MVVLGLLRDVGLVLLGRLILPRVGRAVLVFRRIAVPRQLVIVNKTDLPAGVEPAALVQRFGQVYPLSAATGEGVDALCRAVEALYPAGKQAQGELLTNARQADAVARSLEAVRSARRALEDGMTPDVVLTDAEAALEALGELNGKRIREDLVQTIFSRFCVGK